MPRSSIRHGAASLFAATALLAAASPAHPLAPPGPTPPASPTLVLEAVEVEPPAPPPATLCRLQVRLRNRGPDTVSGFVFQVRIDGREVAAGSRRLYLIDLEPGAVETLRLPNFWSSEGGRPVPASGELTVEVRLVEAHRVRVEADRRPPTRTFTGAVERLPIAARLVLAVGGSVPRSPRGPAG